MDDKPFSHSPLPPDLMGTSGQASQPVHAAPAPAPASPSSYGSPSQPSHKKSMPAWLIIIIVLVISGAAVAGILYYQNNMTQQPPVPQIIPTPTISPDDVSNDDSVDTIDKEIDGTKVDEFATDSSKLEKDIGNL